jgi:selenoprotein W-related protein
MKKPHIVIEYCPGCKWLLRSAWLAQELLTTFEKELGEVTLRPSETTGTFIISVNETEVWERKKDKGFPEAKILKRRVRDLISPDLSLGHSDQ